MKTILVLLAFLPSISKAAGVLINGNQINPASSMRIATFTASGYANFGGSVTIKGPSPWIDVTAPKYGAKHDNSTNDLPAIQGALNDCPSIGSCAVFLPYGIYRTSSTINISTSVVLFGEGPGTTIKYQDGISIPANSPLIRIRPNGANLQDIRIHDLIIDGSSATNTQVGEWDPAIAIQSYDPYIVKNVHLYNLISKDTLGDCFTVESINSPLNTRPTNIFIHDNVCQHWKNNRQGVAVTAGENVQIYSNVFSSHSGTGYAFDEEENPGETVYNLLFFGNTISSDVSNGIAITDSSATAAGMMVYGNSNQANSIATSYNPNTDLVYFGNSSPNIVPIYSGIDIENTQAAISVPFRINTSTFVVNQNAKVGVGVTAAQLASLGSTSSPWVEVGAKSGSSSGYGISAQNNSDHRAQLVVTTNDDGQLTLWKGDNTANTLINTNGFSYFNGGSVGFGTTTPAATNDVEGNIISSGSSSGIGIHGSGGLLDLNRTTGSGGIRFQDGAGNTTMALQRNATGSNNVRLYANGVSTQQFVMAQTFNGTPGFLYDFDSKRLGLGVAQGNIPTSTLHVTSGTLTVNGTASSVAIGSMTVSGVTAPPNSQALCLSAGALGHCISQPSVSGTCTCVSP